jgi:hypothetical protein
MGYKIAGIKQTEKIKIQILRKHKLQNPKKSNYICYLKVSAEFLGYVWVWATKPRFILRALMVLVTSTFSHLIKGFKSEQNSSWRGGLTLPEERSR